MANYKKHRKETLLREFENAIHNVDYLEAMKKVGALYYSHVKNAREKEAMLLFLMKEYKRVIQLLSDSKTWNQFEKELYFVSLAYLDDFDSVNRFLEEYKTICQVCYVIVGTYFLRSGKEIRRPLDYDEPVNDFFRKQYLRNIALELASIYQELEHAEELHYVGIDMSSTKESCIKRIRDLGMEDYFLDCIVSSIEKTAHFNYDYVNAFIYKYIAGVNKNKDFFGVYTNLDDIIFHLDLEQQCRPEVAVLSSIEYIGHITDGAMSGNKVVGDYLKRLVTNSLLYPDRTPTPPGMPSVDEFWKDRLSEFYPEFLNEIETYKCNQQIYEILSNEGKIAFKAATWQFDQTISDNYGLKDAGMLCLSYMRIIELELNNFFIRVLTNPCYMIKRVYDEKLNTLHGKARSNFTNKWQPHIKCLTSLKTNHTLERLWYLFCNLSLNRDASNNGKPNEDIDNRDEVSIVMINDLSHYLNENGMAALASGRFVDMIDSDIRNKYRNPPAHTKYVTLETAFECKSYVENLLLELDSYKKK